MSNLPDPSIKGTSVSGKSADSTSAFLKESLSGGETSSQILSDLSSVNLNAAKSWLEFGSRVSLYHGHKVFSAIYDIELVTALKRDEFFDELVGLRSNLKEVFIKIDDFNERLQKSVAQADTATIDAMMNNEFRLIVEGLKEAANSHLEFATRAFLASKDELGSQNNLTSLKDVVTGPQLPVNLQQRNAYLDRVGKQLNGIGLTLIDSLNIHLISGSHVDLNAFVASVCYPCRVIPTFSQLTPSVEVDTKLFVSAFQEIIKNLNKTGESCEEKRAFENGKSKSFVQALIDAKFIQSDYAKELNRFSHSRSKVVIKVENSGALTFSIYLPEKMGLEIVQNKTEFLNGFIDANILSRHSGGSLDLTYSSDKNSLSLSLNLPIYFEDKPVSADEAMKRFKRNLSNTFDKVDTPNINFITRNVNPKEADSKNYNLYVPTQHLRYPPIRRLIAGNLKKFDAYMRVLNKFDRVDVVLTASEQKKAAYISFSGQVVGEAGKTIIYRDCLPALPNRRSEEEPIKQASVKSEEEDKKEFSCNLVMDHPVFYDEGILHSLGELSSKADIVSMVLRSDVYENFKGDMPSTFAVMENVLSHLTDMTQKLVNETKYEGRPLVSTRFNAVVLNPGERVPVKKLYLDAYILDEDLKMLGTGRYFDSEQCFRYRVHNIEMIQDVASRLHRAAQVIQTSNSSTYNYYNFSNALREEKVIMDDYLHYQIMMQPELTLLNLNSLLSANDIELKLQEDGVIKTFRSAFTEGLRTSREGW